MSLFRARPIFRCACSFFFLSFFSAPPSFSSLFHFLYFFFNSHHLQRPSIPTNVVHGRQRGGSCAHTSPGRSSAYSRIHVSTARPRISQSRFRGSLPTLARLLFAYFSRANANEQPNLPGPRCNFVSCHAFDTTLYVTAPPPSPILLPGRRTTWQIIARSTGHPFLIPAIRSRQLFFRPLHALSHASRPKLVFSRLSERDGVHTSVPLRLRRALAG